MIYAVSQETIEQGVTLWLTFLRFFQQKSISLVVPIGARRHKVSNSNGNAGYGK